MKLRMNSIASFVALSILIANSSIADEQAIKQAKTPHFSIVYTTSVWELKDGVRKALRAPADETILLAHDGFAVINPILSHQDSEFRRFRKLIFNRKSRKLTFVDSEKSEFLEHSVHGVVQFRLMELEHRRGLCAAFEAGGLPQIYGCTQLELESLLGLHLPLPDEIGDSESETIKEVIESGKHVFFGDAGELARFHSSTTPLSDEQCRTFLNYLSHLRYFHPEVRKAIRQSGHLPQELTCQFREFDPPGTEKRIEIRYELKTAEPVDNSPWGEIPADFRESYGSLEHDLGKATLSAIQQTPIVPGRSSLFRKSERKVRNLLKENKDCAALMEACRYFELSGNENGYLELCRKLQSSADPLVTRFWSGRMRQAQFEKLIKNVATEDPSLVAVAEYLLADTAMNENWKLDARKLLVSALNKDPLLSGAWLDLGRVYNIVDFDMQTGWKCWEISRRIAPQHPNLIIINDLMKSLEEDFPDFF